ncbi:MAG TPA: DEAD/DEAH box helicase [Geobacteraceae bacterium]
MNITETSLSRVDSHWAVLALGEEARDRGLKMADARLVKRAVGAQIEFAFDDGVGDDELLHRLSLAYELAALEGLGAFLNPTSGDDLAREQCAAGAWRAFEIRRLFDLPEGEIDRVFHVLHLSALAYCGDRWSDLRRWYQEDENSIEIPSVADVGWDLRLLYRLFECWVRLFRKRRWDDLDRIREIIAGLREDQKIYESGVLNTGLNAIDRTMAIRLISLYHWAKGTELLAIYMIQGEPADIPALLDKHFEAATEAAATAHDANHEMLMRWLHAASRQMVAGSVWWVSRAVNSRVTKFVREVTKQQALFELLPPQRAALQEMGLLDTAATAVVVDMPTSGGKTLLAQFRMLQAINQFDTENGWVAYVAPNKALTAQITRRLRRDFEPIGVKVEQLTGAVEVDAFEEELLKRKGSESAFDVLVATPEKLQLVIRNKKVPRPLALVVLDEAHNIEDESRGLRIELLLATIKRDCTSANFLLLMPYVEKAETLARWLAQDVKAGRAISLGTTTWKPNERIVGMYWNDPDGTVRGGWRLRYQTLTTTPKTIHLEGAHNVGGVKPLKVSHCKLNLGLEAVAMASVLSSRGTSIAIANNINSVWKMARHAAEVLPLKLPISDNLRLVQEFLRTEISPDFELISLLSRGVGVHHAGLSDEVRALIEWLAEDGELQVLCATNTIAQGINFPVSSVFLASRFVPQKQSSREMSPREFWNLAGRAGRMNQDSVGVVGLARGKDAKEIVDYVCRQTGELVSRLVSLLNEVEKAGHLNNLETVIHREQWDDFRCYVAHLWAEKKNLDAVLADTEQLLRNTFGYGVLRTTTDGRAKADKLLEATRQYARKLADNPGVAQLADMTGFSPEGVRAAFAGLSQLERELTPADWSSGSLFGDGGNMASLFGVMLRVPQLSESLNELGGRGNEHRQIAEITKAWVNGKSIREIAQAYFSDGSDDTKAVTDACKAIYRTLVNSGTWGMAALAKLGIKDFDSLPEAERRQINALPAMIYHGVKTEEAVLMRMNSVPRSIAENLGESFRSNWEGSQAASPREARQYLKQLTSADWGKLRPTASSMSGTDYKHVWELLSGESG